MCGWLASQKDPSICSNLIGWANLCNPTPSSKVTALLMRHWLHPESMRALHLWHQHASNTTCTTKGLMGIQTIKSASLLLLLVSVLSIRADTSSPRVDWTLWCVPWDFSEVALVLFQVDPCFMLVGPRDTLGSPSEHSVALCPGFPQQKHVMGSLAGEVLSVTVTGGTWQRKARLPGWYWQNRVVVTGLMDSNPSSVICPKTQCPASSQPGTRPPARGPVLGMHRLAATSSQAWP